MLYFNSIENAKLENINVWNKIHLYVEHMIKKKNELFVQKI